MSGKQDDRVNLMQRQWVCVSFAQKLCSRFKEANAQKLSTAQTHSVTKAGRAVLGPRVLKLTLKPPSHPQQNRKNTGPECTTATLAYIAYNYTLVLVVYL